MATITKTMQQDAIDTVTALVASIRSATTKADADRAFGGAIALANYAQVWSVITEFQANALRNTARRNHAYKTRKGGAL